MQLGHPSQIRTQSSGIGNLRLNLGVRLARNEKKFYVQHHIVHKLFAFFAICQNTRKFSDAIKESREKLSDSVETNSPKSQKLSVAKYRPLKIVKLNPREKFPNFKKVCMQLNMKQLKQLQGSPGKILRLQLAFFATIFVAS